MRKAIIGSMYVVTLVLGMLMLPGLVNTVEADTGNVTTRWIVPADTTISISFPNGQTLIEFNAAGKNFTDLGATAQTDVLAALAVTNNGNTAVKIEGNWTAEWPTGIVNVNISIGDNTNATALTYTTADETTKQEWNASLPIGSTVEFWFWSSGTEVAETAGVDRTLMVTSTNV